MYVAWLTQAGYVTICHHPVSKAMPAQAAACRRRRADISERSHENDTKTLLREHAVVRGAENGAPMEPLIQLTLRLLRVPRRSVAFFFADICLLKIIALDL